MVEYKDKFVVKEFWLTIYLFTIKLAFLVEE
jgi:hypothetical protein